MGKIKLTQTKKYRKSKVKNCPTCGRFWGKKKKKGNKNAKVGI